MKKIQILIALMALSFAAWGQAERVKTVETPDSASLVIFDTTGNNVAGTNVQDAIEESNPTYNNHVWISETGGNNATGKLGDPHRAFADPWVAQDSLMLSNLSFLAYQGDYVFSGPYSSDNSTQALTRTDTFRLLGMPGSRFEIAGATSQIRTFITDVTGASSTVPRSIYIDAPNSSFNLSNAQALTFPISVYNPSSQLYFRARSLNSTGGRIINTMGGAKKAYVQIDSIDTSGGIPFGMGEPLGITGIDTTITRNIDININYVKAGSFSDQTQAFRYQTVLGDNQTTTDSLSTIKFNIGTFKAIRNGLMMVFGGGLNLVESNLSFHCNDFETINSPPSTGAMFYVTSSLNGGSTFIDTFTNSKITLEVDNAKGPLRAAILGNFFESANPNLVLSNSIIEINIGTFISSEGQPMFKLDEIELLDSSIIKIHCDYCECTDATSTMFLIGECNIPTGSKIIISGTYIQANKNGELILIEGDNIDLTGLQFQNATFVNDGTAEWIESINPITITEISGLWSNSSSAINVNLQENKKWGFNYPKTDAYYDLQTILDSIFISIPKQSATFYQATLRQYAFASGDTILIDTMTNALITDSITQDTGYIRNISSDTIRWQVSYNFFKDSDEDPLYTFVDLTTDGSDDPEAIPGSRATTEQTAIAGIPAPGPTFIVDVPPGDAIRLCAYSIAPATTLDVLDLTITVQELYRE